jgi:hypothetical protein
LKVVLGTKCSSRIFEKFFRSKKTVFTKGEKFFKNFGAAFGTWYYLQKKLKKQRQYQVTNTGSSGRDKISVAFVGLKSRLKKTFQELRINRE